MLLFQGGEVAFPKFKTQHRVKAKLHDQQIRRQLVKRSLPLLAFFYPYSPNSKTNIAYCIAFFKIK